MKVKKRMNQVKIFGGLMFFIFVHATVWAQDSKPGTYVGSEACLPCHEEEHQNFTEYARKSHSFQSILNMKKGLTPDEVKGCYSCHTTGYGKPGGFVSLEQTPELKNAGCEVCHGPGGRHAQTEDPDHISREVTIELCNRCHTKERIGAFRFRPLVHGGGH